MRAWDRMRLKYSSGFGLANLILTGLVLVQVPRIIKVNTYPVRVRFDAYFIFVFVTP